MQERCVIQTSPPSYMSNELDAGDTKVDTKGTDVSNEVAGFARGRGPACQWSVTDLQIPERSLLSNGYLLIDRIRSARF